MPTSWAQDVAGKVLRCAISEPSLHAVTIAVLSDLQFTVHFTYLPQSRARAIRVDRDLLSRSPVLDPCRPATELAALLVHSVLSIPRDSSEEVMDEQGTAWIGPEHW
jgi:hypothetical protein